MSNPDIRAALLQGYQLAFTGQGQAVPATEYENAEFSASDLTLWTSIIWLPVQPVPVTIGEDGEDEHNDILQIDINVLRSNGEKPLFDTLDLLRNFFTAGRSVTYNNHTVTIKSCGVSSGREVDSWWRRSVSVYSTSRSFRGLNASDELPNLNFVEKFQNALNDP